MSPSAGQGGWPPRECDAVIAEHMLSRSGSIRLGELVAAAMAASLEPIVEWCDARAAASRRDAAAFPETAEYHKGAARAYDSCVERIRSEARRFCKPGDGT